MSHHANEGFIPEELRALLGATGNFPEGKISDNDEGEIKILIGSKTGTVFIEFGKPVSWVGLTPRAAENIGLALVAHAKRSYPLGQDDHAEDCGTVAP